MCANVNSKNVCKHVSTILSSYIGAFNINEASGNISTNEIYIYKKKRLDINLAPILKEKKTLVHVSTFI